MIEREKSLEREMRAFRWVRLLAELPDRSAGAPGEREAAARVGEWLREIGAEDVSLEAVPGRPRTGLALGLYLLLGALGAGLGGAPGALCATLAAASFRREQRTGRPLLARWPAATDSVSAIGRAGSRAPRRRVVLCAHLDAGRAGWIFARGLTGRLARRAAGARGGGPLALLQALLLAAAALAWVDWLGASGALLSLARAGVVAALALGGAAALQWARAPVSPGANANASGVAAMLTCGEQLLSQLPDDVELWLVAAGAGEAGGGGARRFVEAHPHWPVHATWFLDFEYLGGGALHYVRSERGLRETVHPPMLVELARRVAASGVFERIAPVDLVGATGAQLAAERGHPALALVALEPDGRPRNHLRLGDVPEDLDLGIVVRAADFGAAVARAALRGEAGPIAIL